MVCALLLFTATSRSASTSLWSCIRPPASITLLPTLRISACLNPKRSSLSSKEDGKLSTGWCNELTCVWVRKNCERGCSTETSVCNEDSSNWVQSNSFAIKKG